MVVQGLTRIERCIASLQPRCAIVDFYRKGSSFAIWAIWAWAWIIGCVLAGPLAAQPASVGAPLSKVGCRLDGVGCSGIAQLSYSSNVLSLINGTSHQAIRVYYTDDGAGNAEWLSLTSNDGIYSAYNVAAGASGTGVAHPLIIGSTGPAVSVDPSDDGYLMYSGSKWFLWRSGVVAPTAGASNAADLGIAGTNLWRSGFFGTSVAAPLVRQGAGFTVATLPAGTQGDFAYVTDALAPAYLTAVVGGGAVVTPVFYNGAAWVAH